jgi:[ribosomal protein S5]-alanine N-acetyltransferase
MEIIEVNSEISLTPYYKTDSANLVKYLNDRTVYENMLMIPYPYSSSDAEWFLNKSIEDQKQGIYRSRAIRIGNELIGGAGFKLIFGADSHKDEIAYWLAAPFRNRGIITEVVKVLCKDAFRRRNLERIEAIVFDFNKISPRVLTKAGFKFEGTLRKYYKKDGKIFDGQMYSIIAQDLD